MVLTKVEKSLQSLTDEHESCEGECVGQCHRIERHRAAHPRGRPARPQRLLDGGRGAEGVVDGGKAAWEVESEAGSRTGVDTLARQQARDVELQVQV